MLSNRNIFKTDGCIDKVPSGRKDADILDLIVFMIFFIMTKIQIHKSNLLIDANSAQPVEDRQEYVSCHWGGHHIGKVDGNKLKSLYEYQIL